MTRRVTVGAAQLGPIARTDERKVVVGRLLALLAEGHARGCDLVVFPELALTTFFPRWFVDDRAEFDHFYETSMPGPDTQPLFDEARRLGVGFCLGYAELTADGHRYNSQVLVERDGSVVATFRKVHIPGHEAHEPDRPFQHAERWFFEPGPDGFGVWPAFGGRVGMMICNDRRWPETYRVMGLQGVELILCGYNTPIHYAPDPSQDVLQGFHNALVMQAGAYQNGTWVVGVAKGGVEEGVDSLAQSMIVAPSGQIVAQALTAADELVVATCDLDWCRRYTSTVFDFARYRRPEVYGAITAPSPSPTPTPSTAAAVTSRISAATRSGASSGTNVLAPGTSTIVAFGNAAASRWAWSRVKNGSAVPHTRRTGPSNRCSRPPTATRSLGVDGPGDPAHVTADGPAAQRCGPGGGHVRVEAAGERPEPELAVADAGRAHPLRRHGDRRRMAQQRHEAAQRWRREVLEGVAVRQHQPPDPRRIGVEDVLADGAAGVVADQRHVVQLERLDEGDDLSSDAAWRLVGVRVDGGAVRSEREVGGERADAMGGQRIGRRRPQRAVDQHAVDEHHRRAGGVGGTGGPVVQVPVGQRDRRHGGAPRRG